MTAHPFKPSNKPHHLIPNLLVCETCGHPKSEAWHVETSPSNDAHPFEASGFSTGHCAVCGNLEGATVHRGLGDRVPLAPLISQSAVAPLIAEGSDFSACLREGDHLLSSRHNKLECPAYDDVERLADAPFDDVERCRDHGARMVALSRCRTDSVLDEVADERARQFERYGTNDDLRDGTGENVSWLNPSSYIDASLAEKRFRTDYERHEERHGKPTWMLLVREEIAEAFMESDVTRLREELIQVAALAVSWVESLDERKDVEEGL